MCWRRFVTSSKQANANRQNAKLSTGPVTDQGKLKVSGNRTTHGILSNKLLLANENPEDYHALLDGLQDQLRPVGILELALVERIAVSLWRQRRLIRAEAATIALSITSQDVANTVGAGMGIDKYGARALKAKDLEPPDQENIAWCEAVLSESEDASALNLEKIQDRAPLIFAQLSQDAEEEGISPAEYLDTVVELNEYIRELITWCKTELEKADQYEQITRLIPTALDKLSCPLGNISLFSKYQVTLDNQTYKALKALREAQEWRLKTIEAEPVIPDSDAA